MQLLIKERTCPWYTVAGTRLVRLILTRAPKGHAEDRVYFCTDIELSASKVLERFARRWLIEVCFRDVKQHLGAEDPQNGWSRARRRRRNAKPGPQPRGTRGRTAVLHTAPLAFVVYGIVALWYLEHGDADRDVRRAVKLSPWYRQKASPSFADMLVSLRRETWARRLSGDPHNEGIVEKLRRMLPDALLAA